MAGIGEKAAFNLGLYRSVASLPKPVGREGSFETEESGRRFGLRKIGRKRPDTSRFKVIVRGGLRERFSVRRLIPPDSQLF